MIFSVFFPIDRKVLDAQNVAEIVTKHILENIRDNEAILLRKLTNKLKVFNNDFFLFILVGSFSLCSILFPSLLVLLSIFDFHFLFLKSILFLGIRTHGRHRHRSNSERCSSSHGFRTYVQWHYFVVWRLFRWDCECDQVSTYCTMCTVSTTILIFKTIFFLFFS